MINIDAFSLHQHSSLSGYKGEEGHSSRGDADNSITSLKKIDKVGDVLIEQTTPTTRSVFYWGEVRTSLKIQQRTT